MSTTWSTKTSKSQRKAKRKKAKIKHATKQRKRNRKQKKSKSMIPKILNDEQKTKNQSVPTSVPISIHFTADETDKRCDLTVSGFIRISQNELVNTSNKITLFNNIPDGITTLCHMYYYNIRSIFDEAFQTFMNPSISSTPLDGNQYFLDIFLKCANSSNANRHHMIKKQLISILGNFYLGKNYSLYAEQEWNYHPMDPPPDSSKIIQVIVILLRCCCSSQMIRHLHFAHRKIATMTDSVKLKQLKLSPTAIPYKPSRANLVSIIESTIADQGLEVVHNASTEHDWPNPLYLLHALSKLDGKLCHNRRFYHKMVMESHSNADILNALNDLIVHWSFEDKTYSQEWIITMIVEGIDKSDWDKVHTFLSIMHRFIKIDDSLTNYRLSELHSPQKGVLHIIKCYKYNYPKFTYQCIKKLTLMMLDCERYAHYMINIRDRWNWWDAYLIKYFPKDQESKVFYTETYRPLLLKYDVECQTIL